MVLGMLIGFAIFGEKGSQRPWMGMVKEMLPKTTTARPETREDPGPPDENVRPEVTDHVDEPRRLVLTGTRVGRTPSEGVAFLGTGRDNPQTYSAGALLGDDVRLVEIHEDYVVLARGAQRIELRVENSNLHAASQSSLLLEPEKNSFTPAVPSHTEKYTAYLRPNPIYEGDELVGYEVYPGRAVGIFGRLGFQGGDVITEINGQAVRDPQAALAALSGLSDGASLSALVKRNGKPLLLSLDGAILLEEAERARNQMNGNTSAGMDVARISP